MSKTTPSSRSKRYLEGLGYMVGTVERYNHITQRRHDLFGFIDLIAVRGDDIVGLQVTSDSNISARVKKIKEECDDAAKSWIAAGGLIVVQGWGKKKVKRKSPRETWQHRSVEIVANLESTLGGELVSRPHLFRADPNPVVLSI